MKFDKNRSNLYTVWIFSKWFYTSQNQMRDWSWWRFANNSRHAESLSRLLKPQTNRTTGPPGVNEDGSRFPGKSNPLQTRLFFISIAQWSVEENDTIMSKVAKSKGKTRGKNGKTANCVEEQDNESTYSFQNYDSRWLFFYQGWYLHEEEEPPFFNIIFQKQKNSTCEFC